MTIAQRVDEALLRIGLRSRRDLATACDVSHVWLGEVLNEKKSGHDLVQKLANTLGVSANWLRTGDPSEAPLWADRKQVVLDAAKDLADRDRAWMLREIEHVYASDDVQHTPAAATAELVQLRADRDTAAAGIQALHRRAVEQLAAVEELARQLGVALSGEAKPSGPARDAAKYRPRERAKV